MDFYLWNFAVLALLNVLLAFREYRLQETTSRPQLNDAKRQVAANDARENLKSFKWRFLPVYLLVNGADWLQVYLPIGLAALIVADSLRGRTYIPYIKV